MVVAWLVLGVVLVLFELHHLAFYALFAAIGSLAAAIVAWIAPSAYGAQVAVAAVVAALGVVGVRPLVSRAFHRGSGQLVRGVHGGLVGDQGVTLDVVGEAHEIGHVRLAGERWLAVSGTGERIPAGSRVVVTSVEGTTLCVWPIGELPGSTTSDGADGMTR
jgi:membrane protein implicated in regulation of membrane protease activity